MKHHATRLLPALLTIVIASCSTPRDVTYFQDAAQGTTINVAHALAIKVKPGDRLDILVTTTDPSLSALFNLMRSQSRLSANTSANRTSNLDGNAQTALYTVDPQGNISFPVLGKLHIAGLERSQVAEYIATELIQRNLVKDPVVNVEFANTGISILGEVQSPGRYEFNRDNLSIVEAIAMAGDLTTLGKRTNVAVLREDPQGNRQVHRIDLTNVQELAQSPVYYLQQNDVIYIEPNDKKKRETTPNGNTPFTPSFWISIGSFATTLATLIITLTK